MIARALGRIRTSRWPACGRERGEDGRRKGRCLFSRWECFFVGVAAGILLVAVVFGVAVVVVVVVVVVDVDDGDILGG